MSKICNRNYKGNGMYTMTMIDGVGCCPSCKQPAQCHGATVEYRALFWALSGNTGTSSSSLARHMMGINSNIYSGPPSDASDRMRCIRLLELIPEWLLRLGEMHKYDAPADAKPNGMVINSSGISDFDNSWQKQIPLIIQEGKL